MIRRTFALTLLAGLQALSAATVQNGFSIGQTAGVGQLQADPSGNLYAIVYRTPIGGLVQSSIAKVLASGVLAWQWDAPSGVFLSFLAVAPDGSTYAAGSNYSFTPSTMPLQYPANSFGYFLIALNGQGDLVKAANLGDLAPSTLAIDSFGNPCLSGRLDSSRNSFTAKVNAGLDSLIYLNATIGSGVMATGPSGKVYLSGDENGPVATPGAFQSSGQLWVAVLDAAGSVANATYLGDGADIPHGIAVDSDGNIYIAGSTNSLDYPVTSDALQPNFPSAALDLGSLAPVAGICRINPLNETLSCPFNGDVSPSPGQESGFISVLNATATGLTYSTFFGGSGFTGLNALTLDLTRGRILLEGYSNSTDLPGLGGGFEKCMPAPFIAALTLDGAALLPSIPLAENDPSDPNPSDYPLFSGSVVPLASNIVAAQFRGDLALVDRAASSPLTCATAAADQEPTLSAAPGQLLTLFGSNFAQQNWSATPVNGRYPTESPDHVYVTIGGLPAPLLYTSAGQINVQVPFELTPSAAAILTVHTSVGVTASQTLNVLAAAPAIFTLPVEPGDCVSSWAGEMQTVAINADGSRNGCGNPARPGSVVTVFLNGLGLIDGMQTTGGVNGGGTGTNAVVTIPSAADCGCADAASGWSILSVEPLAGSITGMYAVRIQVGTSGYDVIEPLFVNGTTTENLADIRVAPDQSAAE